MLSLGYREHIERNIDIMARTLERGERIEIIPVKDGIRIYKNQRTEIKQDKKIPADKRFG